MPKLYSETGELLHFAGGPILTPEDIVGPTYFDELAGDSFWVMDTTGFGGVQLELPPEWIAVSEEIHDEVFVHQADVFITRYRRSQ